MGRERSATDVPAGLSTNVARPRFCRACHAVFFGEQCSSGHAEYVYTDDTPPPEATYVCVKKSQMRAGAEMDSPKTGVLAVGTEIDAMERRMLEDGTVRVHFGGGWVSVTTRAGGACLKLARGKAFDRAAAARAEAVPATPEPSSAGPVPNERADKAKPNGKAQRARAATLAGFTSQQERLGMSARAALRHVETPEQHVATNAEKLLSRDDVQDIFKRIDDECAARPDGLGGQLLLELLAWERGHACRKAVREHLTRRLATEAAAAGVAQDPSGSSDAMSVSGPDQLHADRNMLKAQLAHSRMQIAHKKETLHRIHLDLTSIDEESRGKSNTPVDGHKDGDNDEEEEVFAAAPMPQEGAVGSTVQLEHLRSALNTLGQADEPMLAGCEILVRYDKHAVKGRPHGTGTYRGFAHATLHSLWGTANWHTIQFHEEGCGTGVAAGPVQMQLADRDWECISPGLPDRWQQVSAGKKSTSWHNLAKRTIHGMGTKDGEDLLQRFVYHCFGKTVKHIGADGRDMARPSWVKNKIKKVSSTAVAFLFRMPSLFSTRSSTITGDRDRPVQAHDRRQILCTGNSYNRLHLSVVLCSTSRVLMESFCCTVCGFAATLPQRSQTGAKLQLHQRCRCIIARSRAACVRESRRN